MLQRPAGSNTIAVIGDSHACHLYAGLTAQAKENEGIVLFPSGCSIPLMGLHSGADPATVKIAPYRANTEHLMSEGFSYILSHKNIRKVVLSHRPGCSCKNVIDTLNPSNHDFYSILHDGFVRTYDALTKAGKEIYVIKDNPYHLERNYARCQSSVVRRPTGILAILASKTMGICSVKQIDLVEREMVDNWDKVSHETAKTIEMFIS